MGVISQGLTAVTGSALGGEVHGTRGQEKPLKNAT